MRNNAFTFPYTFFRQNTDEVFTELKNSGLSGINLALNYHGSRDFLLRQGPQLEYLVDGFHYYLPDPSKYHQGAIKPRVKDHLLDNSLLNSVLLSAKKYSMELNAWCVFMHNSAVGLAQPSACVTNAFGNKFLSELCPSNPGVAQYAIGMVSDLASRGICSVAIESMHWHGARHGEHHERFFMELSPTTEFLFSLCFCSSCIAIFNDGGGNGEALKSRVAKALQPFLDNQDIWLEKKLTKAFLAELLGPEILNYLISREATLTEIYVNLDKVARVHSVKLSYVDQVPLMDSDDKMPLSQSWLIGIDNLAIRPFVSEYLPLMYRKNAEQVNQLAKHYVDSLGGDISAILRPTYPDNDSKENLIEKVLTLKKAGMKSIDFYLLDTWRPKNLQWVKAALERIA